MEHYSIIKDEKILRDFIDFLPELETGEVYYVCLFARKKYSSSIKRDKAQLKRFTSTKERLFSKIRQLEAPFGAYIQGDDDQNPIPQDSLAVYITANPRSNIIAAKKSLVKIADMITKENVKNYNLHQDVMSEIQKARSRSVFVDFDFDHCDHVDITRQVGEIIPHENFHVLVTRGGFHLMINPDKVPIQFVDGNPKKKRNWFTEIKKIHMANSSDIINHGDNMIPVAGCTQGNFVPYLYKH